MCISFVSIHFLFQLPFAAVTALSHAKYMIFAAGSFVPMRQWWQWWMVHTHTQYAHCTSDNWLKRNEIKINKWRPCCYFSLTRRLCVTFVYGHANVYNMEQATTLSAEILCMLHTIMPLAVVAATVVGSWGVEQIARIIWSILFWRICGCDRHDNIPFSRNRNANKVQMRKSEVMCTAYTCKSSDAAFI